MELHVYKSLPSTNRAAYEAAREGAEEFYTVVAESQTAGRGRMARSFHSPAGGAYFSTVLRPEIPLVAYGKLTPIAAVAVHRAILRVTGCQTEIKWVNDLLLDRKKVCGILAESGTDRSGRPFVILGIGINTSDVEFPQELRDVVTFVPCGDPMGLIRSTLEELAHYKQWIEEGDWLSYYRAHSAFLGERVRVIEGDHSRLGTALDVLEDGALLVDFGDGKKEALRGGEISIRAAQNDGNRHIL